MEYFPVHSITFWTAFVENPKSDCGLPPNVIFVHLIVLLGMEYEGLYRVPADTKKRMELLKHFDKNYDLGM